MKKFLFTVLASLFVIAAMTGCGKSEADEAAKMRVAFFPNLTHAQAHVMKEKGILEEKVKAVDPNCEISYTSFNAGPDEVQALFAGEIDLGYIGPVPAISAYMQSNGDVKVLAGVTNGGAVLVAKKGLGITSIADLDGKKVAIPQLGNTQHLNLINLLNENGLKAKSDGGTVDVMAVSNSNVQSMMDQGEVDAALVPEPWGTKLELSGLAEVVLDYRDIWLNGDYPVAVVVVRTEYYEKHKDLVDAFLAAHDEATKYFETDTDDAFNLVNKSIAAITGAEYEDEVLKSAASRLIMTTTVSPDAMAEFAKLDKEAGFITSLPDDKLVIAR